MAISWKTKVIAGLTLLSVPTIMYGGITLLGILTNGSAGLSPEGLNLSERQWALWRAGHAHAGVWVILALVIQILIDATDLSSTWEWTARIGAPLAAVIFSGGFFGLAFLPVFKWALYLGALNMTYSTIVTGVGLLLNL